MSMINDLILNETLEIQFDVLTLFGAFRSFPDYSLNIYDTQQSLSQFKFPVFILF